MTKKNKSDVGYPYHLQPNIIKVALFIHNAEDEQEKINRVEFGLSKFDYKFMAHVMALLMQKQQCSFCIPLKFYYEETGRAHPKRSQTQAT